MAAFARTPVLPEATHVVSVLVKFWRGPFSLITDEGVGEDEELSHDRHDGDLGGFSGFDHGFVFGLELRGQSDGVESGHVESLSGSGAPGADGWVSKGPAGGLRFR